MGKIKYVIEKEDVNVTLSHCSYDVEGTGNCWNQKEFNSRHDAFAYFDKLEKGYRFWSLECAVKKFCTPKNMRLTAYNLQCYELDEDGDILDCECLDTFYCEYER